MKRMLAGLAVAVAVVAVAVPSSFSATPNNEAEIVAVFNADGSATLKSTKGLSNYEVTPCVGEKYKVELSGDLRTLTVFPRSSPISSIAVKSAQTRSTFTDTGACNPHTPPPPPPPPHDPPPPPHDPPPPPHDPPTEDPPTHDPPTEDPPTHGPPADDHH